MGCAQGAKAGCPAFAPLPDLLLQRRGDHAAAEADATRIGGCGTTAARDAHRRHAAAEAHAPGVDRVTGWALAHHGLCLLLAHAILLEDWSRKFHTAPGSCPLGARFIKLGGSGKNEGFDCAGPVAGNRTGPMRVCQAVWPH